MTAHTHTHTNTHTYIHITYKYIHICIYHIVVFIICIYITHAYTHTHIHRKRHLFQGLEVKESEFTQLCPTHCDPMDSSLPGSSIHGIFQARILEWVAISFSRGSSPPRDLTQVSRTAGRLFTNLSYQGSLFQGLAHAIVPSLKPIGQPLAGYSGRP